MLDLCNRGAYERGLTGSPAPVHYAFAPMHSAQEAQMAILFAILTAAAAAAPHVVPAAAYLIHLLQG